MQSGGKSNCWVLQMYDDSIANAWDNNFKMPFFANGLNQIVLRFSTLQAAISYADDLDLEYEVISASKKEVVVKSYADNFK